MADYPDAEQVAQNLFTTLGYACKWLPDPDQFDSKLPIIAVARVGGTDDGVTDRAELQIDTWAKDRPGAWALASQVRERINALVYGGDVDGVWIDHAEVLVAGQLIPTEMPDDRRVTQRVRIDMRRPL
ncbi:DUF3168 domain-containing protein [Williamsia muralis]|uniref:phage tail termination protein n=1 Tax=Williamsia marianensis TaxID=85044 RepID=UPI003F143A37